MPVERSVFDQPLPVRSEDLHWWAQRACLSQSAHNLLSGSFLLGPV